MEVHYQNIMNTFCRMMNDINRYCATDSVTFFLEQCEKMDVPKVLYKLVNQLMAIKEHMDNLDDFLTNNEYYILPEISLSLIWPKLSHSQQSKIKLYIKLLIIEAEIVKNVPDKKKDISTLSNELGFNPFDGIQPNKNTLELADISKCIAQISDQQDNSGSNLDDLLKTFGVDKFINIEEILKNFDEKQAMESLSTVKSFLKDTISDETAELMDDIVHTTFGEIKNKNIKNTSDILNVCSNLKDKLEAKNHSIEKIIQDTGKMLDKMKTNPEINKIPEAKAMLDICGKLLNNTDAKDSDIAAVYKQLLPSMMNMGNMSKKR